MRHMYTCMIKTPAKLALLGAALVLLQACSPVAPSNESAVAQAFETSDVIAVKPYTRTIFSSSNF